MITVILIAGITVMQLVAERDGKAGRPLKDAFHSADRPVLEIESESAVAWSAFISCGVNGRIR